MTSECQDGPFPVSSSGYASGCNPVDHSGRSEHVGAGVGMVVPTAGGLGPAVYMDGLSRHVAGQITGQKDGGTGHLVDVTGTTHRYGETEGLLCADRRDGRHALGHGDVRGQG